MPVTVGKMMQRCPGHLEAAACRLGHAIEPEEAQASRSETEGWLASLPLAEATQNTLLLSIRRFADVIWVAYGGYRCMVLDAITHPCPDATITAATIMHLPRHNHRCCWKDVWRTIGCVDQEEQTALQDGMMHVVQDLLACWPVLLRISRPLGIPLQVWSTEVAQAAMQPPESDHCFFTWLGALPAKRQQTVFLVWLSLLGQDGEMLKYAGKLREEFDGSLAQLAAARDGDLVDPAAWDCLRPISVSHETILTEGVLHLENITRSAYHGYVCN